MSSRLIGCQRSWRIRSIRIPEKTLLYFCVDEKSAIQAARPSMDSATATLGTAQQPFSRHSKYPPDWSRRPTINVDADANSSTSRTKSSPPNPGREIHVVLDNLSTHKPKEDRWLKRHRNVPFRFIPTYSSWLNQVECWFSILSQQALGGASFTSPPPPSTGDLPFRCRIQPASRPLRAEESRRIRLTSRR